MKMDYPTGFRIKVRMGFLLGLIVIVFLVGCQARNAQSIQSSPEPRIIIQDIQEMVLGQRKDLDGILPIQVTVIPTISKASSGPGFVLKLNWTFRPPKVSDSVAWTAGWNLKVLSGPDETALEPTFLGGPEGFPANAVFEWLSIKPMTDNLFVFKLSAFIISGAEDGTGVISGGEIALKSISVDLRGLK